MCQILKQMENSSSQKLWKCASYLQILVNNMAGFMVMRVMKIR
ncbi:Chloride conductance regulatory protein ICln [Zea mays]|uniref:Chloride conductance regulatory protein ICln n=1 Tax=Zea mays TaxID=4577 RepID=A0A1D6GS31_MAIZE|nr:Chloride conductance regulatory protein ICln [Zea mays]